VVDRLDWLVKQNDHGADGSSRGIVVAEEPEPVPTGSLILDYDSYDAWEWAEPIEKMVEDAIFAVVCLESELPEFNELAVLCKLRPRSRGKRARAARAAITQDKRSNDSVEAAK
jgi:hypothetical protein